MPESNIFSPIDKEVFGTLKRATSFVVSTEPGREDTATYAIFKAIEAT